MQARDGEPLGRIARTARRARIMPPSSSLASVFCRRGGAALFGSGGELAGPRTGGARRWRFARAPRI